MTTFQIGDRVVCPVLPYMGEMTILYVYETQKKIEFVAKGSGAAVQGTAAIFALATPELKQLNLF